MIDKQTKDVINKIGDKLAKAMPGFYGKVILNIHDGVYVSSNVEQSIKPSNLKKGT